MTFIALTPTPNKWNVIPGGGFAGYPLAGARNL
jgi:hypothetical protein